MSDFETRLATLLNERVDARLGPQRPAPPLDVVGRCGEGRQPRLGRRRWTIPFVAAAGVSAVVVGLIVVATVVASHMARQPDGSGSPANVVHLGGASIVLPDGWAARVVGQDTVDGQLQPPFAWCLEPRSQPVPRELNDCPVRLTAVHPTQLGLDVDGFGGTPNNYSPCRRYVPPPRASELYGQHDFGGRAAEWRRWTFRCSATKTVRIEQYVVATVPSFILNAEVTNRPLPAVLPAIAHDSTLPAQTSSLRLADRGLVRSVRRAQDGVHVTLDRTVDTVYGYVNTDRTTYTYLVPTAVFDANRGRFAIRVGSKVYLATDGTNVTEIDLD
jgi:hypothetical protein